jgi:hypothetical protein
MVVPGEWSARPDGNRTLVTHRVYDVAQGMRWGVPLANRFFIGFTEKTRNGFERTIIDVACDLCGAAVRVRWCSEQLSATSAGRSRRCVPVRRLVVAA